MVASQNEYGSLPSSAIFWKSLSKIGVSSSLTFWQNSAVKPSGPGLLFSGRFLITDSISMLVMGLLRSSIYSLFSFGKLYFSKNLSIFSKLSILLAQSCWQQSFMILCISEFSVVISPFSFLILLIWFFFLYFLISLANGLSILFTFTKKQLLVLLIFAMVSFVSFAFIYALIFKISFLLLTLGFFISSFSSSLRCRVGYLFDFFLVS